MLEIDQYIVLFLEEKAEEMDEFKDSIKSSNPDRKLSHKEWEIMYLSWADNRKDVTKLPRILLSED